MTKKRKFVAGVTNVIGGALVEFEQQIMRGRPRTEQRYLRREQDTAAASDGGTLSIKLPDDLEPATEDDPLAPGPTEGDPAEHRSTRGVIIPNEAGVEATCRTSCSSGSPAGSRPD